MPDLSELFRALASAMEAFMSVLRGGDPAPFIDRLLAPPATPRRNPGRALLRQMLLDNAHVFTQFPPGPAFRKLLDPPSVRQDLLAFVNPADKGYRRTVHRQLTIQESRHRLARKIFHGQRAEFRQASGKGRKTSSARSA
jgi:Tn3 transposase DDE domain